jgi:Icc-related predicted phosphoesterase
VPDVDLLLLAGDYCPSRSVQHWWYRDTFAPWLSKLSGRMKIIAVAGNHDEIFEEFPASVPRLDWTYLQDSGTTWRGYEIYGTPWQPRFYDWAFNADEPELERIWRQIPSKTDILVLHGPPRGYGDFSPYGKEHTGSPSLLKRIEEIKPKLVVAGHIHSGYGQYMIGETIFVNASHVNEQYVPVNTPIVVDLPDRNLVMEDQLCGQDSSSSLSPPSP